MPQNPFGGPQPLGVVYITNMDRPDAALALSQLYGFQGKRESRIGSVCITGAGLQAAVFCDIVGRFLTPGPARNGNQSLPIGLPNVEAPLPSPPMVRTAVEGKYERTIKKVSDTSVPEAVIRNGVIFNAEAAIVLSAPATYLAKSLDLLGVKELYKERVKRLVIVDAGGKQDDVALRKVIAEFPAPIFFCPPAIGEALPFPAAAIEKDFTWAPSHPVVDAYRAFKPMPYDAPSHDLAATWFAVHPDNTYFQVGEDRALRLDLAKKDALIAKFVEYASAKPPVPQQRTRQQSNTVAPAAAAKPPEKPAEKKQNY